MRDFDFDESILEKGADFFGEIGGKLPMIPLNRNLLKLKRSGIRAYSALAAETPGCISLTLGEPEFDTPAPVTAAGKAALDGGKTHYANAGLGPAPGHCKDRKPGPA